MPIFFSRHCETPRDGPSRYLKSFVQSREVSARSINKLTGRLGPVWQDESFDHVLRGDESVRETIEYIRQNPARKGLVIRPEDYQWFWIDPCGAGTPAREL
jgi:hypothetical protein